MQYILHDPKLDPNATKFEEISYIDVLNKDLKVMDSTATAMCRDNNIPLISIWNS